MTLATLLLAFAASPGCRKGEVTAAVDAGPAGGLRRYTVRGEVVRIPAPGGDELFIRHEAIDDFVDASGQAVGMASMTMPFRIDRSTLAQGLAVGDKVELRFAVDWSGPSLSVEQIRKLPATTALRFEPARPLAEGARSP